MQADVLRLRRCLSGQPVLLRHPANWDGRQQIQVQHTKCQDRLQQNTIRNPWPWRELMKVCCRLMPVSINTQLQAIVGCRPWSESLSAQPSFLNRDSRCVWSYFASNLARKTTAKTTKMQVPLNVGVGHTTLQPFKMACIYVRFNRGSTKQQLSIPLDIGSNCRKTNLRKNIYFTSSTKSKFNSCTRMPRHWVLFPFLLPQGLRWRECARCSWRQTANQHPLQIGQHPCDRGHARRATGDAGPAGTQLVPGQQTSQRHDRFHLHHTRKPGRDSSTKTGHGRGNVSRYKKNINWRVFFLAHADSN